MWQENITIPSVRDQTASTAGEPAQTTTITMLQGKQRSLNTARPGALPAEEAVFVPNATELEETMPPVCWQHMAVPFAIKQVTAINAVEPANSRSTKRGVC